MKRIRLFLLIIPVGLLSYCNFRPADDTPEWSMSPRGLFLVTESNNSPAKMNGLTRDLEDKTGQFKGKIRWYKTFPDKSKISLLSEKIIMVGFAEATSISLLTELHDKILQITSQYGGVNLQFEIFGLLSPFPELGNMNFITLSLEKRTNGFMKSNGRHKNALLLQEDEHLLADKTITGTAAGFFLNQTPYHTLRITGILEPAAITRLNWSGQYYSALKKAEIADLILLKHTRAADNSPR